MKLVDRVASLGKAEIICYAVGIVCLIAGLWIGVLGVRQIQNANASTNWAQSRGTVTESQVERDVAEGKDGNGDETTQVTYRAVVQYKYEVGNKFYTSKQVSFSTPNAAESTAEARVNKYPTGAMVTVYYAPTEPGTAVLEPGVTFDSFWQLIFGLMFVGGGIICFVIGYKFGPYLRRGGGTFRAGQAPDAFDDERHAAGHAQG